MNSITPFRSPEEKLQVVKALDEMFICQDKRKTDEEIGLLANELMACNYAIPDIIVGINSLKSKVYQQIKLRDIKNAIEDRQPIQTDKTWCKYCEGSGTISLRNGIGVGSSSFGFRCFCSNGDKPSNRNLPLWQGKENQGLQGKDYIYPFWEVMQTPVKDTSGYFTEKSQPKEEEVPF